MKEHFQVIHWMKVTLQVIKNILFWWTGDMLRLNKTVRLGKLVQLRKIFSIDKATKPHAYQMTDIKGKKYRNQRKEWRYRAQQGRRRNRHILQIFIGQKWTRLCQKQKSKSFKIMVLIYSADNLKKKANIH